MQNSILEKDDGRKIYNIHFYGLKDLYDYLISNPQINYRVFNDRQSEINNYDFSGESLSKSINYLLTGCNDTFPSFLEANNKINKTLPEAREYRGIERTFCGGVAQPALVAANVFDCNLRYVINRDSKIRNIYFNLGYNGKTKDDVIINRGLATLYIIQALENKGEIVNFKAFDLSYFDNEIFNFEIDLKKPSETFLNIQKCYYPLVRKEFIRRLQFRVLESQPFTSSGWGSSYGRTFLKSQVKDFYKVDDRSIIINQPQELGIKGKDIYDDIVSVVENLNLKEDFDIEKIKSLKK